MNFIHPILAFKDNYIWMIKNEKTQTALVVDPGDAEPVLQTLYTENLELKTILVTHHHFDHSGGILELEKKTRAQTFGTKNSLFEKTNSKKEGDQLLFDEFNCQFKVLEIPGHTLDHIAFYGNISVNYNNRISNHSILFCGDTLFTAGCGRVFEGTHQQMLNSLAKLKTLYPKTLIFCGHEYTETNLKFALFLEPKNNDILKRNDEVIMLRKQGKPTVPAPLDLELKTNPFLRTNDPSLIQAAEKQYGQKFSDEIEVFAAIRNLKNDF